MKGKYIRTEKQNNAMSKIKKKWWGNHPEAKDEMSKIQKSKKLSEETKKKIGIHSKKVWKDPNSKFNSKEYKIKMSKALKNRKLSEEHKQKISKRMKKNNPMKNKKTKLKSIKNHNYKELSLKSTKTNKLRGNYIKISKKMQENNPMKNPEIIKKMITTKIQKNQFKMLHMGEIEKKRLKGLIKKPNKPEQFLIDLFKENNLPYKYVGDGDVIIGRRCPDFINCNGQKKIIELFGTYWHLERHKFKSRQEAEEERKKGFSKYGFKTLIIWEDELKNIKNVLSKIENFN